MRRDAGVGPRDRRLHSHPIARGNGDITFAIEKLPLFTGRKIPGSCMAVLHANAGVCIGAALALCARVVMVEPHEWQKYFRLGTKKDCGDSTTKWKNKLKAEAIRRFPSRNITLKTADALLILEWARLTISNDFARIESEENSEPGVHSRV
jgi:hypothetical protein